MTGRKDPKCWTNAGIEVTIPLDTSIDGPWADKDAELEHLMEVVQDAVGVNAVVSGRWVDVELDEKNDLIEIPRRR